MKKISILLLAAVTIVACGNSSNYSVDDVRTQEIKLHSQNDSINFLVGFMTGLENKMHFAQDSSEVFTEEFVHALEDAYMGQEKEAEDYRISAGAAHEAIYIGSAIREQERTGGFLGIDVLETNFDLVKQGFVHGLDVDTATINPDSTYLYLSNIMRPLAMEQEKKNIEKAQTEGAEFLAENAKREGVKTTASGLQYEVLVEGEGKKPTAESTVKVHYEGALIDGTIFDSSYQRGEPIEFPLSGVIKGWTEGLQLMPVGSTYMLYIPYELGYGEHGAGRAIPPYATLVFKVELLEIK